MPVTTQAFKGWLKSSNNIKLSSDASALRVTHEGITNFASLSDFCKKSIEILPIICKNIILAIEGDATNSIVADASIPRTNISLTSASRLITSFNSAKCYVYISRAINTQNMGYAIVLVTFTIEYEAYISINDDD